MNDRERILNKTNDGLDVFKHFLGDKCVKRCFPNRLRSDSHPSCRLYHQKRGNCYIYYMKDYGDSRWSGDCFHLVSVMENMDAVSDFRKILLFIDKELDLGVIGNNNFVPTERPQVVVDDSSEHNTPIVFNPIYQWFGDSELKYWNKYGITKNVLDAYHVKSVCYCHFERQDGSTYYFASKEERPVFAYLFDGGKGVKFYQPFSPIRFSYAGNLPKPYVFGLEQLPSTGDVLYITGGEKDCLSLVSHGFHSIAFNSETALFPSDVISSLAARFKHLVVLFDSDDCGKRESAKRVGECKDLHVCRVVLPLPGTKESKDVSDWFVQGRSSEELSVLTRQAIIDYNKQYQIMS